MEVFYIVVRQHLNKRNINVVKTLFIFYDFIVIAFSF